MAFTQVLVLEVVEVLYGILVLEVLADLAVVELVVQELLDLLVE